MKTFLFAVVICAFVIGESAGAAVTEHLGHWKYNPKPCMDCWNHTVAPQTEYWDGCNQVMCESHDPPKSHSMTRCWCQYIDCLHTCGNSPFG